jgi:putative transposase
MRRSRFTESQLVLALRQAESGTAVADVCRTLEITEDTFSRWKKQLGRLGTRELRQLRYLRGENRNLKQSVADLSPDKRIMQPSLTAKKMVTPAHRRCRGDDVVRIFTDIISILGAPARIAVDDGSEFTSRALGAWAYWNRVRLAFSRPGKPVDHALIKAFNGSLRRRGQAVGCGHRPTHDARSIGWISAIRQPVPLSVQRAILSQCETRLRRKDDIDRNGAVPACREPRASPSRLATASTRSSGNTSVPATAWNSAVRGSATRP